MSDTTKLSDRLRMMYIEAKSKNPGGIEGFDTPLFFEAIAAAEATEAKTGEAECAPVGYMTEHDDGPMYFSDRTEALGDAQHHLSNNRIGEVCIAIDKALAALREE